MIARRIEMENISCPGQSFRWKKDHPSLQNNVKSVLNISKEEKEDHEQPDFLERFTRIEEGERHLDEVKPGGYLVDGSRYVGFKIQLLRPYTFGDTTCTR
jgi:hypothetical protein